MPAFLDVANLCKYINYKYKTQTIKMKYLKILFINRIRLVIKENTAEYV